MTRREEAALRRREQEAETALKRGEGTAEDWLVTVRSTARLIKKGVEQWDLIERDLIENDLWEANAALIDIEADAVILRQRLQT